jgi:antitoxin CptB
MPATANPWTGPPTAAQHAVASPAGAGAGADRAPIDPVRLARLRWRCRRGMLENDLVLARFLDARGAAIGEDEIAMLDVLLDLPDHELWDLIAGRIEPAVRVAPLVAELRGR